MSDKIIVDRFFSKNGWYAGNTKTYINQIAALAIHRHFWTWMGAYVILLLLPEEQKTAVVIATLITAWHHSTRMVMYYVYERIW